jgi:hypothetical protein
MALKSKRKDRKGAHLAKNMILTEVLVFKREEEIK